MCEGNWLKTIARENEKFEQTRTKPNVQPTLDSLAYTVYSSGTTGKPKGRKWLGKVCIIIL